MVVELLLLASVKVGFEHYGGGMPCMLGKAHEQIEVEHSLLHVISTSTNGYNEDLNVHTSAQERRVRGNIAHESGRCTHC